MRFALILITLITFILPCHAQTVDVELVIEAFDGSGCAPSNPPICPDPANLDGLGCNAHDGSTNAPHSSCSNVGLTWPSNYPNPTFWGAQKLDENWWNQGYPVNWLGNNQIKNGDAPANQGSQGASIDSPQNVLNGVESANIGYISSEDPQEEVGGFGRILIEQIRQEYNANNPGDLKPEPVAGMPVKLLYDILRVGDGGDTPDPDPQNPTLKMRADAIAVFFQPIPASATWTDSLEASRFIPADGQWHTYEIGEWADFPEAVYMGIGIQLTTASYPALIPSEQVKFYIDNVRIVYQALPGQEICDNGGDEDGDGLIDCDDPDCTEDPNCPCNAALFADHDVDGDVDHVDFAVYQRCHTGPGFGGVLTPECACFDATSVTPGTPDGSIDQLDFSLFLACASGPNVPADPACDD